MWRQFRIMELQNKNVVITGASMGIGEKMAEAFDTAAPMCSSLPDPPTSLWQSPTRSAVML